MPYYNDPFFTPQWISKDDKQLDTFHRISPFSLLNQAGDTVTNSTFANKIYVADFFFTRCPGICPKMTENMSLVQAAFLDDPEVLLISHSVTPNQDSEEVLKEYAKAKGVLSGKWHLVTGNRAEIYRLGREDYFVEEDLGLDKKEDDFIHTENFVLIDFNGHIRGIYNGLNKASVNQLIADIGQLKDDH
ncbi:MAG: SCO family protein [Candidatus Arcticimaribacter sp.]